MPDLTSFTPEALRGFRDALLRARYSGQRRVAYEGREVEFRTDAELRAAIADAERRLAAAGGEARVSQLRVTASKGYGA